MSKVYKQIYLNSLQLPSPFEFEKKAPKMLEIYVRNAKKMC